MSTKDKILACLFGLLLVPILALTTIAVMAILKWVDFLGVVLLAFIVLCFACLSLLMISFTFTRVGLWRSKTLHAKRTRNLLVAGEVVVWLQADGTLLHLSAPHEAAKALQLGCDSIVDTGERFDKQDYKTVMDMWLHGNVDTTISSATRIALPLVKQMIQQIRKERGE